ncbi:MAG: bis-aminopropyl spermidine synthase family protein [Candidatus Omnitrophica bacterium]|jgi:hypothetical protein|nr:bis-aminopropyl spermidine synthase family protein [Candidatus Omnitrophota bacterium]
MYLDIWANRYRKFLSYHAKIFQENAKCWVGVQDLDLSPKKIRSVWNNYEKPSFFGFLKKVKDITGSLGPSGILYNNSTGLWPLYYYLSFLKKEGIVSINKKGRAFFSKKEENSFFVPALSGLEIKARLESRLKRKIDWESPVTSLLQTKIKSNYDQMPISIGSCVRLIEKILEYIPYKKTVLFVGDDDLTSVLLCLACPDIECLVFDIDKTLLGTIEKNSRRFKLKIKVALADILKGKKPRSKDTICAFVANPIYTFEGVKKFCEFGNSFLGPCGGFSFLEIGDEAIKNRFIYLQEFFAKNNLLIREITKGEIVYPWIMLHKEDQEIMGHLSQMMDKQIIQAWPKLVASLWVAEYIPFKVKKPKGEIAHVYL